MIYEPAEDSFLLQNFVKKYAKGIVLDMGTGSGIQAKTASFKADLVIGLDISKNVIKYCEKNSKGSNIYFFKSNLFQIFEDNFFYYDKVENKLEVYEKSRVEDREKRKVLVNKQIKFDLIIFNPPYLPQELKKMDIMLEGGKKGYEVLNKFLDKAPIYLKKDGKILIVFSSFTDKKKIDGIIAKNNLKFVELVKKHMFFEDIYVYYIAKP